MTRKPFGDYRDDMVHRYAKRYMDALEPLLPQIASAREEGDEELARTMILDALKEVAPAVASDMTAEVLQHASSSGRR